MGAIRNQPSAISNMLLGCVLAAGCWLLIAVICPLGHAGELKIGYVNLARVFDGYQRTKESDRVLEQKGKQKQSELEGRLNELKQLRQSLELLNEEIRSSRARELEERSDEFQRLKTRSERELLRERNHLAREILDEIDQVVAEHAKANGFAVILDQRSLLYGEDLYDVTDEVLRLLNDRYAARTNKASKP
jgi:outer membrane protein